MEITIQAALIGAVVGSLLGGCIAYFISKNQIKTAHQNALALLQRQEFIKAAIAFRFAFLDILIFCKEHPTGIVGEKNIAEIITESVMNHEKAILLFRSYLPTINCFSFDQAWNEYSQQDKWNELNKKPIFMEYGTKFDIKKEIEMRHLVASRIDKLFQFAPLEIENK